MADKDKQLALIEDDFKVTGSDWVHLFRYIIETGSLAEMTGGAWKVYTVIKLLSGFQDGRTTESHNVIGKYAGLSVAQVKRAINELKNLGYLYTERKGRRNSYQIIEKIPTEHISGSPDALAEIPYRRLDVQKLVKQIRNEFVKKLTGTEGIRDVNIIINTGNIQNIVIGGEKKDNYEDDIQVEFSLVDEFNKKIAERPSK